VIEQKIRITGATGFISYHLAQVQHNLTGYCPQIDFRDGIEKFVTGFRGEYAK